MNERIKLSRFADSQGISYEGAYKMWRNGLIEGIQLPTGTILVSGWKRENNNTHEGPSGNTAVIYARVSSAQNEDRLTRFGYPFTMLAVAKTGQCVEIVNQSNPTVSTDADDLMQDFVAVVTIFCARLYGLRRRQRKTETLIRELAKAP